MKLAKSIIWKKPFLWFVLAISILFCNLVHSQNNDECAGAIPLNNLQNWCSAAGAYSNSTATASNTLQPSCWSNISNDVWFSFVAVSKAVNIKATGNGTNPISQPEIQIMGSCTQLQPACGAAAAGSNEAEVYLGSLTIGQTYYVRVDGVGNATGSFQLCIDNTDPPATPGQDCATATHLCNKNTFSVPFVNGGGAYELNGTCKTTENNSTWYTWTAATNGTLTFTADPNNPNADLDMVLFELENGSCNQKKPLRCTSSASTNPNSSCMGATGLNFNSTDISESGNCQPFFDNMVKNLGGVEFRKGKKFALVVTNFNSNTGFTISFGGSGEFEGPVADFDITGDTCFGGNGITINDLSNLADSYDWDFGDGATPPTSTSSGTQNVTYNTPGTKTITLTITGGDCDHAISKEINISNCALTVIATASPEVLCVGACTNLSASIVDGTPPFNVSWNKGVPTGEGPHNVCPDTTTAYIVNVTDANNNVATDTIIVTVNQALTLEAGSDTTICIGDSVILGGNPTAPLGAIIAWTPNSGISDTTLSNPWTGPSATTTYYLTGELNGCFGSDSVVVTIAPPPIVDFSTNGSCSGDTSSFTNLSIGTSNYIWNFGDGDTSWSAEPQHVFADTGSYLIKLIGFNGSCIDSVERLVNIVSSPEIGFTADTLIGCENLMVQFTDTSNTGSIFLWDFGDGNTSSDQHPSHQYLEPGSYNVSLTVTNDARCLSSISKIGYVEIISPPVASFEMSPSVTTVEDPNIVFTDRSTGNSFSFWDFGDNNNSTLSSPEHEYADTGSYIVTLVIADSLGCVDTVSKRVIVNDIYTIFVPNSFTPNGDKINDFFKAEGHNLFFKSYTMTIFSRWGLTVFKTDNVLESWNGRYDNGRNLAPEDSYAWVIDYIDLEDKKFKLVGHVTLVR